MRRFLRYVAGDRLWYTLGCLLGVSALLGLTLTLVKAIHALTY